MCAILFTALLPIAIFVSAEHDEVKEINKNVAYATKDEISTNTPIPTIEATTIESDITVPSTAEVVAEQTTEDVKTEIIVVEDYIEETKLTEPQMSVKNDVSEYELDLLARTIYQEAGSCGEYCQWLVGSTVLNLADERGGIEVVVFDYNTFNVAYSLYNATPSDLSYSVASRLLSGDRDYCVKAFRTSYYHDFGTPYISVDNVYFSTY